MANHPVFDPEKIQAALRQAWSAFSSTNWTIENPAAGQCSASALVVQEVFGGCLLKTRVLDAWHFYNKIDGRVYDFTESQFTFPPAYQDTPVSVAEVLSDTSTDQYAALHYRFLDALLKVGYRCKTTTSIMESSTGVWLK